ncbi:MAG: FHA domain-containing protein [Gammaproteobacteria bacterium]|nr:FHA domain-containing protein [Gammaproteobacteria bacterium]MDH5240033.1 FHA domain-containing protein [Gammaproteobacteria bacterium]MDH5261135.1 FHA domain-containing protein [Gammaproteobacteria bacterium]
MANDNKNINDLVAEDDDPTVELQMPLSMLKSDNFAESDAQTYDSKEDADRELPLGVTVSELEFDLESRQKTISRLQYDIQQLHTKWLGLETEIGAREAQTNQLNDEIQSLRENATRKENLIKKRDRNIKALKAEIRQREIDFRQLAARFDGLKLTNAGDALRAQNQTPDTEPKHSRDHGTDDLRMRLQQSEKYADSIRQQSQDLIEANTRFEREIANLTKSLSDARDRNLQLNKDAASMAVAVEVMQDKLDAARGAHENEMRILRFELGEAQSTAVQSDELNSQLASDLVDTRNFKEELERMLGEAEEKSATRIHELQKEVTKLTRKSESLEQKLSTKSEAISILLAELAKKSEHIESIGEIGDVIHDIDERMTERSNGREESDKRATVDRITRVLIGKVDDQVLRFPLFKNRLTIGRTNDNDIQLKAAYISRHHAVIETDAEQTRIIDTGSKNGIQVNAEKVASKVLTHGDVITIGSARFEYEERKKRDS